MRQLLPDLRKERKSKNLFTKELTYLSQIKVSSNKLNMDYEAAMNPLRISEA